VIMETWLKAIKKGRTFATNGPLLRFELGGEAPGGELRLDTKQKISFKASLASIVPIDHLQVICNGKIAREIDLPNERESVEVSGTMEINVSGWCLLRAFSDRAEYPVLDLYPYATTSPIYFTIAGSPIRHPDDAAYFLAWMDRLISAAERSTSWNTDVEKQDVLSLFHTARQRYEALSK
jgi:TolB protein